MPGLEMHIPDAFARQLTRTPFYFAPVRSPVSEGPALRSIPGDLAL
jgi:hypothetical protein